MDYIGIDNFFEFLDIFGGTVIYVPTKKRVFGACVAAMIRKEFDGSNIKKLAYKYQLSDRTIRNYVYYHNKN